jgi:hypothetical protein
MPIMPNNYICEICDFICYKKSNYEKHLSTRKHKILTNPNNLGIEVNEKKIICNKCNKNYKHASTLSAHKKKCIIKKEDENIIVDNNLTSNSSEVVHLTNLVMKLINTSEEIQKKQNEIQQQILDIQKQNLKMILNNNIIYNE